jgi:hypothetical protein
MMNSKVKKQIAPLFLLVYFLFAQVYPYLHVHVHSEENQQHVEFTFHPVDGCDFEHAGEKAHHHENDHFQGDWEHTVQKTEVKNSVSLSMFFAENRIQFFLPQQHLHFSSFKPLNSRYQYFYDPLRAPPLSC